MEEILKYIIGSGVSNQSTWNECVRIIADTLQDMRPVDVVSYSIDPDGTLTIIVPKGFKKIGRILIEEDVTRYGGLFYPDTGGCFLSSMERSEQDEQDKKEIYYRT